MRNTHPVWQRRREKYKGKHGDDKGKGRDGKYRVANITEESLTTGLLDASITCLLNEFMSPITRRGHLSDEQYIVHALPPMAPSTLTCDAGGDLLCSPFCFQHAAHQPNTY